MLVGQVVGHVGGVLKESLETDSAVQVDGEGVGWVV